MGHLKNYGANAKRRRNASGFRIWRLYLPSIRAFDTLNEVSRHSRPKPGRKSTKSSGELNWDVRQSWAKAAGHKFRGLQRSSVFRFRRWFAQIFDNLVGCSKEEFVSTLSK